MTTHQITHSQLALILSEETYGSGDLSFRPYSGRGMYGKSCLGLTGDITDFAAFIAAASALAQRFYETDYEDMAFIEDIMDSLINNVSIDSMGLSYVYYWPAIELMSND